ncbi:hypothetical protein JJL56_09445 [Azospirillum sp. YIM DDC1]|uniref:Uncharacterized protein n=1 Tax=Azospirillum aestuarii TaxID=2802052 RepID=A0ABS1HWE0_9PROT|nr:hypothetical protein [Azospirillum aestuarii]MBK3774668.1 hypothetical protein [Azospirillum brasilense]MBK4719094.1 hypothetical protein [Azospirillum aestuarii]TWA90519.1 hypothetical protein FBY14_10420 [Azospirillum brasilense]
MLPITSLQVDDLTPKETAAVAHAYLAALDESDLDQGDHESAFDRALETLRGYRPGLPLNVAAAELELLLASLPAAVSAAQEPALA